LRAAAALNGAVIAPGRELSFNHVVASWTPDRGFVLAPVSYDGQLVVDWGGGVCQTSTTLYNAALLAGMEITERHRHFWPPRYAPPGADAAVHFEIEVAAAGLPGPIGRLQLGEHVLAEGPAAKARLHGHGHQAIKLAHGRSDGL
jgi:hypothetical protein